MAHPMIPLRIIAAQMGMMTGTAMGDMRANWMIIQHTIAVRLPAATAMGGERRFVAHKNRFSWDGDGRGCLFRVTAHLHR